MSGLRPELIQYLVVHCSATSPNLLIGASEINTMHLNRGWAGIGYHIVIRRDPGNQGGLIEYGRSLNKIGAHVEGYNSVSIGICMVGGVDTLNKPENNFTDDQFKALKKTLDFFIAIFPRATVLGHCDMPAVKKACPCFEVKEWWAKNQFVEGVLTEPKPVVADYFQW